MFTNTCTGCFISICRFRKSHISVSGKSKKIKLVSLDRSNFFVLPDHCYVTIKISAFCVKYHFYQFASYLLSPCVSAVPFFASPNRYKKPL